MYLLMHVLNKFTKFFNAHVTVQLVMNEMLHYYSWGHPLSSENEEETSEEQHWEDLTSKTHRHVIDVVCTK